MIRLLSLSPEPKQRQASTLQRVPVVVPNPWSNSWAPPLVGSASGEPSYHCFNIKTFEGCRTGHCYFAADRGPLPLRGNIMTAQELCDSRDAVDRRGDCGQIYWTKVSIGIFGSVGRTVWRREVRRPHGASLPECLGSTCPVIS